MSGGGSPRGSLRLAKAGAGWRRPPKAGEGPQRHPNVFVLFYDSSMVFIVRIALPLHMVLKRKRCLFVSWGDPFASPSVHGPSCRLRQNPRLRAPCATDLPAKPVLLPPAKTKQRQQSYAISSLQASRTRGGCAVLLGLQFVGFLRSQPLALHLLRTPRSRYRRGISLAANHLYSSSSSSPSEDEDR